MKAGPSTALMSLFVACAAPAGQPSAGEWTLQFELDPGQTSSNTLQRPNDGSATRFDVDDFADRSALLGRAAIARTVDWGRPNAELRLDLVPFQQSGTRSGATTVRFDGVTFPAGAPMTLLYQFNTWRLTYDVPLLTDVEPDRWTLRVGATLAIRDAQVRIHQGTARANFVNFGPVPLFYAYSGWRLGGAWSLEADLDAFPAPGGGGLLDTAGRVLWSPTPNTALFAGVRYQAGGATADSFFNFLHQRSAVAGVRFSF